MNPKMLSNTELLSRVKVLAQEERGATAALISHLAELDERRLYLAEGCSSMFTYCTQILHLSEHPAYGRIEAARMARRFPIILQRLVEGSLNLATVCLLAGHLTPENHQELLEAARHKSRRQVEELIAGLRPQPAIPASVRRLPAARSDAAPLKPATATRFEPSSDPAPPDRPSSELTHMPAHPAVVSPLAPQRYKVQFTATPELVEKLRRAQALLRHQVPDGDPAKIFDLALAALLEKVAKKKLAVTTRPHGTQQVAEGSRHIPAAVRRTVWLRDGGRCAFVGMAGRRCTEDGFLEFHHVIPHAKSGESTADNIQLRCRAHNVYEAELDFGLCHQERVREERPFYSVRSR